MLINKLLLVSNFWSIQKNILIQINSSDSSIADQFPAFSCDILKIMSEYSSEIPYICLLINNIKGLKQVIVCDLWTPSWKKNPPV